MKTKVLEILNNLWDWRLCAGGYSKESGWQHEWFPDGYYPWKRSK